jgi:hypothetical protein
VCKTVSRYRSEYPTVLSELVTQIAIFSSSHHHDETESIATSRRDLSTNDLFIKDAFLVFRALCKLTMKPLTSERYVPHITVLASIG